MSNDGSISKNVGLLCQLTIRGGSLTCEEKQGTTGAPCSAVPISE